MLTPIVMPLPTAVAAAVALVGAAWWLRLWLENAYPLAVFAPAGRPPRPARRPPAAATGRHRLNANTAAYRPHPAPPRPRILPVVPGVEPMTDAERRNRAIHVPVLEPYWRNQETLAVSIDWTVTDLYAQAMRANWARDRQHAEALAAAR